MFLIRRVVGDSMLPVLRPGSIVIARRTKRIAVGDVIILLHEGLEKTKRVKQITDGKIFVVGDNLPGSTDSRTFGWIDLAQVRGRVIWPRGGRW